MKQWLSAKRRRERARESLAVAEGVSEESPGGVFRRLLSRCRGPRSPRPRVRCVATAFRGLGIKPQLSVQYFVGKTAAARATWHPLTVRPLEAARVGFSS